MKILVYTISSSREYAIKCQNLLFDNLLKYNSNIELLTITNNLKTNLNQQKYKTIYDDSDLRLLKYSQKIPEGYDAYVYLDSDILVYGNITDIVPVKEDYGLVTEAPKKMCSSPWFRYDFADLELIEEMKNKTALNAGTFVYKNTELISYIYKELQKNIDKVPYYKNKWKLEQSCFNYYFLKFRHKYKILDERCKLFALPGDYADLNKQIFHFCGISKTLLQKYNQMEKFNNLRQNSVL